MPSLLRHAPSSRSESRRLAPLVALVLLAAACTPSAAAPATGSPPSPATTVAATHAPGTVAPAPTQPATIAPTAAAPRITLRGSPPKGWSVSGDDGTLDFTFDGDGEMTVDVLPNRALMDDGCDLAPEPGVGTTAAAIADAVAARNGLTVSRRIVAVIGALSGWSLDLRLDPGVGPTCPADDPGFIPLVGYFGPQGWEFVGVGADEAVRLIVLNAPGGQNVVIYVAASDASLFDARSDEAAAIISALVIE